MKITLKLEEAGMLALCIYLNTFLPYAWWWYWVLFLTPDIGIAAYAVNTRVGAAVYNFFHHKGLASGCCIAGTALALPPLQFAGLLMLGHSSFDRLLGYGLKFEDNFKHTHLGWLPNSGPANR